MTSIIVIDTETTGLDPSEGAALLEVAYVAVEQTLAGWSFGADGTYDGAFIAYEGNIPALARAVHHISPAMVAPDAPGVLARDVWLHGMLPAERPGDMYYVAHNAQFDRQFLPELGAEGSDIPWICTYRCALHIYPDAPGHSCQVLRYALGAEPPAIMLKGLAPHRALYDTACTAALLQRMLETHTPEELVRLTSAPVLLKTCRFGKHRGEAWSDVPASYMQWILRNGDFDADVVHTCKTHLGLAA